MSRSEYASTPDEFNSLDTDTDGRIDAFDLVRAALQKNHDLSEIVAGPWAPIYSAIMNSISTDAASLEEAAKAGAMEVVAQEQSFGGPMMGDSQSGGTPSAGNVDELMSEFLARHDRLELLRSRLDDLANRLGRSPRYRQIDQTA